MNGDAREPTPILVGNVAVFRKANGEVVIHTGSDGRNRCRIPSEDQLGVAAAILPSGTVTVELARLARLEAIEAAAWRLINEATNDHDVDDGGYVVVGADAADDLERALAALRLGDALAGEG